ncbi:MAG: 30S ribosome-binding factor RbfA [Verrucomicrobiota bacterium]
MSQRLKRVNGLLQREVSEQLRRYYRNEAVRITISEVQISTDLRRARVYYSVLGGEDVIAEAKAFFNKIGKDLRHRVSKHVILKYFPHFEYVYDSSLERGANIQDIIDDLDTENE